MYGKYTENAVLKSPMLTKTVSMPRKQITYRYRLRFKAVPLSGRTPGSVFFFSWFIAFSWFVAIVREIAPSKESEYFEKNRAVPCHARRDPVGQHGDLRTEPERRRP